MDIIGKHISHYHIIEELGRGGMGEVYKAEDTSLKRIVALKFLSPELTLDEDARTRFIREAQAASSLQHHNICTIHEIDQTADGRMFICMDYYSGDTLRARTDHGALPVHEAVDIAAQAAEGLARAHEAGVIHRDVKPANIALTNDGVVKILDFGIAMLSGRTRMTRTGTTVGTISYMSPEQASGEEMTARADVWSLGVILYEMLAGRPPFEAPHEAAVAYSIINKSPEPLTNLRPEVPPRLARVVDRALAKDPDKRYRDAGEMALEIREVAKELGNNKRTSVSAGGDRDRGGRMRQTRIWFPLVLAAVIVAAILVIKPLLFEDELVSAPRPIAVISFENRTGDPEYDYLREVLPNLLITALEQSKYLSVVTWERMHDLLEQAGRADVELIDKETGFEVCNLDGIDTIILGSFTKAGDVFVTDVKVLDVHSKELLKSASAKGQGVGSILASQIDELGKEIARGVGLSERSIAETAIRPIAAVTTSNMEAYEHFLRGREAMRKFYYADARLDLEKAVQLDSTFAVAWLYVAMNCESLREVNKSHEAYERAKSLSASAPERDQLYIDAMYAKTIKRDKDKFLRLMTELTTKYPKEKIAFDSLGRHYRDKNMFAKAEEAYNKAITLDPNFGPALNGIAYLYNAMEDYEKAIEYFGRYAAAYPDDANPYDSMGEMYFLMGEFAQAIKMCERAVEIKPDFGSQLGIAYIFALQEDYGEAVARTKQFISSEPSPGMMFAGLFKLAHFYAISCKWLLAIETIESTKQAAEQLGHPWGLAGILWSEAWVRYLMKDFKGSRACLEESGAIMRSINRLNARSRVFGNVGYGLCDLKEGHIEQAKTRLDSIDTDLPQVALDEPAVGKIVEVISEFYRAEILLAEGSIDECIETCRSINLLVIPVLNSANMIFYNYPPERDVLARAYAQKGALDDAIAEYEHLVTIDPRSKERRLILPLFHYRLARLYEEKGAREKAAAQYERFLKIIGEADPSVTEVPDARRRLAELSKTNP